MKSQERRQRAESVLADWLRASSGGGAPPLETVVAEHPELKPEIEELHASWRSLEGLLREVERPAAGERDGTPSSAGDTGSEDTSTPLGRLVSGLSSPQARGDRYERLEEIARGGMGVIHRAWDEDLDREVAMKVASLLPEGDQRKLQLGRFFEEAQISGQLVHPGIVPVHELGIDAEGRPFFTMQLVKGRDLRQVFELERDGTEGWTRTRVLGVLLKACEALAYAHSKGVVHRDLKPGNVMVGRFGAVYVMDWGLARVLGEEDLNRDRVALDASVELRSVRQQELAETPDSPLLTMAGSVVGTPSYMPPEQARGDVEKLDRRADVYAMGAMLYELLAGRMPYVPDEGRAKPVTILLALLDGPPRPLAELAPDAPPELVAIAERAMAREVEDRYPDMKAVAADLSAFLEGRVVRAYETGAWAEARKWLARNRAAALAVGGALAVTVVALAVAALVQGAARAEAEALLTDLRLVARELAEPFPVATRSLAQREVDGEVQLLSLPGEPLREGDRLSLEVLAVEDVSLFVFDQDLTGRVSLLFPLPDYRPENPLRAGRAYVLPEDYEWTVDDRDGPERLCLLAVRAGTRFDPQDWLGDLLDADTLELLQKRTLGPTRGVEARTVESELLVPPAGPRPASAFERLRRLSEGRDDVWVRLLELRK